MLLFFKLRYLDLIRDGQKTATVRPWKTCKLKPGDRLYFNTGLQATITAVTFRQLNTVTDDEVRADGFTSRAAFRAAFRELYPALLLDAPCVVLRFRLTSRRRAE